MKNSLRLLIPLMLLAVASGCGAKDEPSASPSTSSFAECMQKQGITMPNTRPSGQPGERPTDRPTARPSGSARPGGGGMQPPSGVDAETWQKAMQACGNMRPSGAPQGGNTAYTNCLSDHGVTAMPPNTADPKTAEAIKVCEPLRARQ